MKILRLLVALAAFFLTSPAFASQPTHQVNGYDVLFESLVLRPLGLVGLVAGTAVFAAISPLTAIANIPEPHNAFPLLSNVLIIKPAKYTFERPLGSYLSD